MESNLNFKNFESGVLEEGENGVTFSFPLTRQTSVYSLTFDEFQSTLGGIGKDFGSMNMDELLRNIRNAEENQNIGPSSFGVDGSLHRQGSLILPRTLSLKTVDEVWKDMSQEYAGGTSGGIIDLSMSQKQPTLGEITLEEFLMGAGVVREETRANGVANNVMFFNDLGPPSSDMDFGFGYQNISGIGGLISSDQMAMQSTNVPLNTNEMISPANQLGSQQQPLQSQQHLLSNQLLVGPSNVHSNTSRIRGGVAGISATNNNFGMLAFRANGIETGSPVVSTDALITNNADTSSMSPVPYPFNNGVRGRKMAAVEKIVERRRRRMIKNRESAARSRARKQAYTMDLEAEVAKLKEENTKLRKRNANMMEMQKKQVVETGNHKKNGSGKRCLRRTRTDICKRIAPASA